MSILPKDADHDKCLKILGIPTDRNLIRASQLIERAKAQGKRLEKNPFDWGRAYTHAPTRQELDWLRGEVERSWGRVPVVMDPMAGGGSIPYESMRLGLPTVAGDLNPVAYVVLKATLEYPALFGARLLPAVEEFAKRVHERAKKELLEFFPKQAGEEVQAYLWARTIKCSNCGLLIPLSPNWWIVKGEGKGGSTAVKLVVPERGQGDVCGFEVVKNPSSTGLEPDNGTDVGKEAICPRCGRVTDGEKVKEEAQAGRMGHQLYAVCTKVRRGTRRSEWVFRAPRPEELEAAEKAAKRLSEKLPVWEKEGIIPDEEIILGNKTREPLNFGMNKWRDLFNPRQLLAHLTYLEAYNEEKKRVLRQSINIGLEKATTTYNALIFDTCLNYDSLLSRWDGSRGVRGSLDMQAFPFKTSYAEFDHSEKLWPWASEKTLDALKEIIGLIPQNPGKVTVYNGDSSAIPYEAQSIDAIVVDPPYHANVMYAEVSDFFYVWLKRTVGDLFPEAFKAELTEKQEEAVANSALFREAEGRSAAKLATQHYQSKMEACFRDMHRVLRDDGVITVMFTHRESEAWASLATALMNAGFTFTSSWPVLTEPGQKFGKADKGVLKATVLLSCRKRTEDRRGLWERVIYELQEEAEKKVKEHAEHGITGPDLLVSVYGPVLGRFANYSIVKDASGRIKNSEDALKVVAEAVNKHLTADIPAFDLDTIAYINLVREFPGLEVEYDLARLTTVFGGNVTLDRLDVKGGKGLVKKKGGKVQILTTIERVDLGIINPNKPETLRTLIDVIHASIIVYEQRGLQAVTQLLRETGRDTSESGYIAALKALAYAGMDESAAKQLSAEARTVSSLLEAMGQRLEATRKSGESLDDYLKK
jgi:adenine-specific DNA methylase